MKRRHKTTIWAVSQAAIAICLALAILSYAGWSRFKDRESTLHILTTNDVHGAYFDSSYVGQNVKPSLVAANTLIDSVRNAVGEKNVLLIDAGDCLQGDNAAYYYNYVDTLSSHLYARIAKYMGYDVITVGNHDVETGHRVYDRIAKEFKSKGIAFLGGNAVRNDNGKPYFDEYAVIKRAGLKVLVLGFTNANIPAWLNETLWSGFHFESLLPYVQQEVDRLKSKVKPDVVIVSVHSGTGKGDGQMLESQGLDLMQSLKGVDFVICAHDHRAVTMQDKDICLINAGSHARTLGHGVITVKHKKGKVVSKELSSDLINVDRNRGDEAMREHFKEDFDAVRAFTMREVGKLDMDLYTRESFAGMCDYMNLIHTLQLSATGAQISFAAPLTYNGKVSAGTLIYNDMFTIYPFENQLYVMQLKGSEIKNYLECSYGRWIQTYDANHVFRISQKDDPRYGQKKWSFNNASFNFDSASGIIYSVDITRRQGQRIDIKSMADGSQFDPDAMYTVAMTSYRASGGGDLLFEGAGLMREDLEPRTVGRYPEIRDLLYRFISEKGTLTSDAISDYGRLGYWSFMPQPVAGRAVAKDMELLFGF